MDITAEIWAVIIQTVVLIVTFIVYMVRREHRMTKVEGRITHLEDVVKPIPGLSRAVARLQGNHDK